MADEPATQIENPPKADTAGGVVPVIPNGTQPAPQPPADVVVTATTPAAMQMAQGQLIAWCDGQLVEARADLADAEENLALAKERKWRTEGWQRQVKRHTDRLDRFTKIRGALAAGYYIVPPFPNVQLVAVRTDSENPKFQWWKWRVPDHTGDILPEGEGRYVAATTPGGWTTETERTDSDGHKYKAVRAWTFLDPDLPFKLAKPEIISETARAMDLKVFDQIGLLPGPATKADPMVVGMIRDRSKKGKPPVTFFIAWWLDTRTL